jgi:hypothetical protein
MENNTFAVSTTLATLQVGNLNYTFTSTQNMDMVRVLYEYLFTTDQSMKEKNKFLLLFLQGYIQENNVELIKRILSENALKDLHPSLIKSALIMTEHLQGIEASRERAAQIFKEKMQAY